MNIPAIKCEVCNDDPALCLPTQCPQTDQDHTAIAPTPWVQKDSLAPIYDANGKVVSFQENIERIVAAVNLVHELAIHHPFNVTSEFQGFRHSARKILG